MISVTWWCLHFFHLLLWCFRADQGRLLDYVVSWGNLTEEKAACYLRDVLEALHYLHNSRIVHLDVKVSSLTAVCPRRAGVPTL